jgi:TBC1 domain family protein 5
VIKLDIDRTYQDKTLFTLNEVKQMMTNILFIWAKENPKLGYKQGMNDLLGILVYVAYCDLPDDFEGISERNQNLLKFLVNKKDLEADLFWCFDKIMDRGVRDLFSPVMTRPAFKGKKTDLFTWEVEKHKNDLVGIDKSKDSNVSPILRRSHIIHHTLLKTFEPDLYTYLEKEKIEPQMYLQRWLRCMLTREFNMHDVLIIWDALLASSDDESGMVLLDYMCVAMIKFVGSFSTRYLVLHSDHFAILRRLFKFPPVEDVFVIINMALRMMNPNDYKADESVLMTIEAPEEIYNKDILTTMKSAIEFIDELITV